MHAADTASEVRTHATEDCSARIESLSNDGRFPTLESIERQVIEGRLRAYEGNKRGTASSLGISLKTLYNKLNEYKAADAEAARAS